MNDLDLKPDDNPMLMRCTLSSGRVEFDFQIVACEIALSHRGEGEPDPQVVVQAMRRHVKSLEAEKSPLAAEDASGAELLMAFARASQAVSAAGKTGGERPVSHAGTAADSPASTHPKPGLA